VRGPNEKARLDGMTRDCGDPRQLPGEILIAMLVKELPAPGVGTAAFESKMRVSRLTFLVLLLTFLPLFSFAEEQEFVKADIYYYGWNVLTRGKLSLDDVRKNKRTSTNILDRNETMAFLDWLRLGTMKRSSDGSTRSEDPRLVIDFWDVHGNRTTYYSGGNLILSEDGGLWRVVDREFTGKFGFTPGQ
jgi:hypothetical protein